MKKITLSSRQIKEACHIALKEYTQKFPVGDNTYNIIERGAEYKKAIKAIDSFESEIHLSKRVTFRRKHCNDIKRYFQDLLPSLYYMDDYVEMVVGQIKLTGRYMYDIEARERKEAWRKKVAGF